jgi:DNA-directed RNA polymerase subunit RPC12/RpoP
MKTTTVSFTEHVFIKSHYKCPHCKCNFETTGDIGYILAVTCSHCGKDIKFKHVHLKAKGDK